MSACRLSAILTDSSDRAVKVTARYSPPSPSYWDRGVGVWLPPEGDEVQVLSVVALDVGADVAEVEADVERIEEAIRCAYEED